MTSLTEAQREIDRISKGLPKINIDRHFWEAPTKPIRYEGRCEYPNGKIYVCLDMMDGKRPNWILVNPPMWKPD